jgi:lytic murein transglycosylase
MHVGWQLPVARLILERFQAKIDDRPERGVHGKKRLKRIVLPLLLITATLPAAASDFPSCVRELRREAVARGITPQTFDAALAGVEPDKSVLEVWDYMAALVDEQRIADGKAKLVEHAALLAQAERSFGVDRHILVAVWGVETDYGKIRGGRPLMRSLATVSCSGHRKRFFRSELVAALRIVQSGDIPAEALTGSWAGAFGQTQFMPSSFQRFAVDFDGDGRRDVISSVADALGSTANYLARAGWVSGESWGYEVRLPPNYKGTAGRRNRQALTQWSALGIRRMDREPLAGNGAAALLLPAGAAGPAFIVFKNFDVIHAYNPAESYVLAIAHLADRLRGAGPFHTPWPTDDPGISRAERREVQQRLADRGFDIGTVDGMIGPRTRAAIEAFQASAGLPVDGRAGARVLKALKEKQ